MLIYLIIVIAVIFMLPSIVIGNWEHFTMLITVTLKRWGAYIRLWQRDAHNPPLVASGIILPAAPARETDYPPCFVACRHTSQSRYLCAHFHIGMHVWPFSLSISPAFFSPNFFRCAQALSRKCGQQAYRSRIPCLRRKNTSSFFLIWQLCQVSSASQQTTTERYQ